MRTNELDIGTWLLKTRGDAQDGAGGRRGARARMRSTGSCARRSAILRRTFARLDVSSRTLFALVERESCFAGTLLELALAADRIYMQRLPDDADSRTALALSAQNFGAYPMVNGKPRLARRFYERCRRTRGGRAHAAARCLRPTDAPRARPRHERTRTTSTGTTRSASRSRSARACRRTR